jgi:hypothetical protein
MLIIYRGLKMERRETRRDWGVGITAAIACGFD